MKKKNFISRLKFLLQHYDGLWSVPLAFFGFYFVGLVLSWFFGYGTGTYDPAFVQPLFLAAVVVIGATNAGVLGLYFTLRGFHRYLYGRKKGEDVLNQSKADWKDLTAVQRLLISLASLAFFIAATIGVYLKLV